MADFSISQFKEYVQILINATKIDDGNGIIEKENGELSKLLSNLGLKESQIGDLLIKSNNSANHASEAHSVAQPTSDDIQKDFDEAYAKYDKMTADQKDEVRAQTIQYATANYEKMMGIVSPMVEPLYDRLTDLPADNITDVTEFKAHIAKIVSTFTQRIQEQMEEMIESYDRAFSEYDITYHTPFELKESEIVTQLPNPNNIPERFMEQAMTEMREYLSEDTTSLTLEENLGLATKLLEAINSLVQDNTSEIETIRDNIAKTYEDDFIANIHKLADNNTQAIQGAPIQKTFADVVNTKITAGISPAETDNKQTPIYDLSGKQVTGELQKGQIYIQNGKKFIVQ